MALQWRETSFLPSHSGSRTQVPIDFEVEEPEEDLDFILEVEKAIEPSKVEISEGFSSSDSENEAQITVIEARRDTGPGAAREAAPVTLEELQNELHMMQNETRALRDLLAKSESSGGEVVEGVVEAWQREEVFEGVGRRADAGLISVGVTSTTSQVVYHHQITEEIVTRQRFPSKRQRRPRGNNSSHSSQSGSSSESLHLREVRDVTNQATKRNTAAETFKENKAIEGASREATATNLPSVKSRVTDDMVRAEAGAEGEDGDDSYAETQATEHPLPEEPIEEDSDTGEPIIDSRVTNEPITGARIIGELVKKNSIQDKPISDNTVTDEPMRAGTGTDEPMREDITAGDAIRDHLIQEEPIREHLGAEHPITELMTPGEPDSVDVNNGRRSRSSYRNMVEGMGLSSSEDNLSEEWNEEDFADELNFRNARDSPDINEATELTHLTMAETDNNITAEKVEEQTSPEVPKEEVKVSGVKKKSHKSSLGVETVVKPYLETNLDNPVLCYQEKESKAKSPTKSESSEGGNDKTPELSFLKSDAMMGPQVEETSDLKPERVKEPEVQLVLEHKTEEAGKVKTEPLDEPQPEAPTEIDNREGLPELPSTLMVQSEPQTCFQPDKESCTAASPTTTPPVADESHAMESIRKVKHRGRSGSRKRPSYKPPPPPRTISGTPSQGTPPSSVETPPEEKSPFQTRSLSYTGSSSPSPESPPRSLASSLTSLESEILAAEDVVQLRRKPNKDDTTLEGFKRVSAVYEELEMIQIPQVPPPPPRDETLQKAQVSPTPSLDMREHSSFSPSPIEASVSVFPEDPRAEHSICLPNTSEEPVKECYPDLSAASTSFSPEGTYVLASDSNSSDSRHEPPAEDSKSILPRSYASEESVQSSLEHFTTAQKESPPRSTSQALPPSAAMNAPDSSSATLTPRPQGSPYQSIDSDSLLTGPLETPSPILSESPGITLSDLEKIEIPEIPPPPPRRPPPPVIPQVSPSPSTMVPPAQENEDASAQSVGVPLAQMLFDLEEMEIPGVPPPPPRNPPPPTPTQNSVSPTSNISVQETPKASLPISETCSSTATKILQPLEGSSDASAAVSETHTSSTLLLQGSSEAPKRILEKLEKMDIPEVPPPPPMKPPPLPIAQSSPTQLCGPSSLLEDDSPTEFKETPLGNSASSSPSISSESSQGQDAKAQSSKLLKKLEEMKIPEVPPPPPRQPPSAALGSTQAFTTETLPIQTQVMSPNQALETIKAQSSEAFEINSSESSAGKTHEPARSQFLKSCTTLLPDQESPDTPPSTSPITLPHLPPSQLLEELENMNIPEVPPPPPRQPPPHTPGTPFNPPISEAHSSSIFQYSPPGTREASPATSRDVSCHSGRDEPLQELLENTEAPKRLSTSFEVPESPGISVDLEASLAEAEKPLHLSRNPITSPCMKEVSSSNLLEKLEKMAIPEVPPPPPRQPPPPPPRQSPSPPQRPLPTPRFSKLSVISESPPSSGGEFSPRQTPEFSSTSSHDECPRTSPDSSPPQTPDASPVIFLETSPVEDSSIASLPTVGSWPPLQLSQVASNHHDNSTPARPPSLPLTQLSELPNNDAFLTSEPDILTSRVSDQQVPDVYLGEVIENSQAKLPADVEETPEAPDQGLLLSYVTALNEQFSPSEEETTSSSEDSSSSEEEHSLSEDEASSSSQGQEASSESEEEVTPVPETEASTVPEINISFAPETQVSPVPDIRISFAPVTALTSDDEQEAPPLVPAEISSSPEQLASTVSEKTVSSSSEEEASFVPEKTVTSVPEKTVSFEPKKTVSSEPEKTVSSMPEKTVSSEPEKTVSSEPEKTVSSVPEETVSSEPEKTVSSVPEKTVSSEPEKTVSSVPEETVSSEPEKTVFSVPEKIVSSVPEKTVSSVPEKTVSSVPEKTVFSVPEKIVSSVPEKTVSSLPEKIVSSVPEKTVSSVPEKTVSSVPVKTVSSVPEKTVFSVPEKIVSSVPEKIVSSVPEKTVSSVPEKTVFSVPEKIVSSVPEKTVSSVPEKIVSSSEEDGVSSEPEKKVSSEPEKIVSSEPERKVSSKPEKIVSSEPEKIVSSEPERKVSSKPEKIVSSEPEKIVSSEPEKKVSSEPEKIVSSEPERKVSSKPEKIVSSEPEKIVSSEPERKVSSKPEKKVSSEPEKIVSSEPEKKVSSEPEKIVSSEPEKKVSSEPENIVSSEPERKVSSKPEKKVSSEPEKIVSSEPERKVSSKPEKIVSSEPEKIVSSESERKVSSKPEKKVSSEPEKIVSSEPEKKVSSEPEKIVSSEPERKVSSKPEKIVSSEPEKIVSSESERNVSFKPEKIVSSEPEKIVSSESERKVSSKPEKIVSSEPEKIVSSEPERKVSSKPEKIVSSVPEKIVSSEPEKKVSSEPEKVVSSEPEKKVSSVPEKKVSSEPEKIVSSEPEKKVSSVPEKKVSSVPEKIVSCLSEEEGVSSETEKLVSLEPEKIFSSVSENIVSSVPEKIVSSSSEEEGVSSEPKNVAASSLQRKVSSLRQQVSSSPKETVSSSSSSSEEEASSSPEEEVSSIPEITISFAPEMDCPYASEAEQEIFSAPDQVPSLVEQDASPAAQNVSSGSEVEQEAPSALHHSASIQEEEALETHQGDASSTHSSSGPTQYENSVLEHDLEGLPADGKRDSLTHIKSVSSTKTCETPAMVAVVLPTALGDSAAQVKETYSSPQQENYQRQRTSLTQEHSAPTNQEESPSTLEGIICPTQVHENSPTFGAIAFSSTQVTSLTTPTEPSPPHATPHTTPTEPFLSQLSEAPHLPPDASLTMQSDKPSTDSFTISTAVEVMDTLFGESVVPLPVPRKEGKGKKEEEEEEESRKRTISQSSEETEEEYFTPPSGTPPYSPRQEKKQAAFGEFSFESLEDSHQREGAEKTVEVVTWGHELEVILEPCQSPRDEGDEARRSHSPPDAGKRPFRQDEATLPSTKRRRLSCNDEEDDFKNVLTVCRVRSRSPSPSGPRVSRIAQAIGEALSTEEPEKSYEILVTVSVMAPSQSTSPESRIRISAQMRNDSPTPPTERPPRPPPTPPFESSATKEDSERNSVKSNAKKSEKDRPTSPPLSLPPHESAANPSKEKRKKDKSRNKRSKKQKDPADDSDTRKTAVTSLKEGEKEEEKEKEEEEENEAAKRAMMEFYVNNLSSDTDSDASTSSTSTSTSSSDDDGEDDGRSYQVTAPGEVGLATIEEDAEEDSGAESSGHWMFSADNTDTDSVIHVPAVLTPAPLQTPQRHRPEDGESTASDETLVVEDDDEEEEVGVCGGGEGRGGRQEAGVTVSNSLARTPATTPATGGHYDSSASEDEHGSQGTERPAGGSSLRAVHRRRRKLGDGRPAGGGSHLPHGNMLGPTHATRVFEKHVDDVFDFESLESCESVSGGSEASSPGHSGSLSGLEEPDAVFNMSATSQPFADASPTVISDARRKTTIGVSAEVTGESEEYERSAVPSHLPCNEVEVLSLLSTPRVAPAGGRGEETEGDLNNVISNSDIDLVLPSTNSDASQPSESPSGPQSMDMFGLPVRWTSGHNPRHVAADTATVMKNNDTSYIEAEKTNLMQMRSDCDTETFANTAARPGISSSNLAYNSEGRGADTAAPCEVNISPPPEGIKVGSIDDEQVGSEAETMAGEAQQQEIVSAAAFTPHTVGENSSEARHRHLPHGPAHHHHISLAPLPQQSEGEAPLLPPSVKDVSEDAMRDALRPPVLRGSTATKASVGGITCEQVIPEAPDSKLADLYASREAGYVPSRLRPQLSHSVTCGADLPSGDSDTDTDNTDGDYDEEDHFAAELSLRISSVPAATTTKVKSFRSSDILNLIGLERSGAGPREVGGAPDDVSPPASQAGSSPEVPDSLRSSEGRSATRSVETLSEDSGLGDRDVRLTPSSPLAPISEAAPGQAPAIPSDATVISRPKRQDARQARIIARARSCGDLRRYSESDSEEEGGAMYGWPSHPAAHPLTEGMNGNSYSSRIQQRPYKPSYTNYLLKQQQQRCGDDRTSRHPHRPLPLSGSEGSDEELRSRFTNHRVIPSGNSKPRRHKSFHEASRQDSSCWPAAAAGKGTWAAAPGVPRPGRRRPQPISVDLAEQFLSQEGLKSPQRKQTVENPYGEAGEGRGEEWRMQHPPSLPGTGGVACQAARATPANQKPPCEASTNGACVGSVGSGSEQCPPASSLTPELTVLRAWPAAQAAPSLLATPSRPAPAPPSTQPPAPAPLPHQYSSTPAQLPNECQPVHTGRSSSTPTHDPPGTTDSELRAASDLNEQCLLGGTGASPAAPEGVTIEMEGGPMRVHTKTYGSHGEVEVYLAKCDNGCRPPNTSPVLTPKGGADHRAGSRGVTFSPSVKEINWRESYYEAEPEGEGSGSDVRKVLVMTSESPTLQRVDLTPSPPPSHTPIRSISQDANNTPESSPQAPGGPVTDSDKSNGRVLEAPAGSSSDAEMSGDKSPRVQTPLWQRFKLPKISSPKSPRPKIPPKPQSLSSRSSDTESSKLSSPGMDSSSSTPSSPDTMAKKTPTSPRFFSWGSKREKKVRVLPARPLVSPPPPPTQVNAGERGEVPGSQGGVKGEPDPAAAVSPAVLPREDRADASDNGSETVRQEAQRVSAPAREERVTESPVRFVNADKPLLADSDGLCQESGRSPLTSATSGEDSSDAGQQPSPRSALSKPPLPPHLQRPTQQVFHKARLLSARRQYFSQERQVSAPERSSPPKEVRPTPAPKPREALQQITASRYNSDYDASSNLKERFERFSASARAERERLARSTPDLSVIEASVRRQGPRIDLWSQCEQQQQQAESHPASPASASDGDAARPDLAHRGASSTHQKARAAIHERYKNRAQRIHARARTQNSGVLETDLDTGASREVLTLRETNLDDLYKDLQHLLESIPPVGAAPPQADKARAKSLLDLEATAAMEAQLDTPARPPDTRAKSMEFLLDDGNKASIQPPENELMKGSERQLSEAELRVRRSLQRLDVPEWMKNAPPPQQGFLLRRRDYGSSSAPGGGWSAYSSKTASMTSLGSSRAVTPNTPTKVVIPTRVATRGVGCIGGVTSPASNCSISPSPSDRSGSLFQYPISRWSTSRLNSGTTTPTGSVTSARTTATYTRQPYLGWRSQTSLANLAGSQSSLTSTGSYLTAADRLALGITAYSQRFVKTTPSTQDKENSSSEANAAAPKTENPEQNDTGSTNGSIKLQVPTDVADVHSSIKEVTSAIVHYCNETTPSPRASPRGSPRPDGRAPSPRRLVWVESSFVGSRPITSPETPTSSTHAITPTSQLNGHDLPESGEVTSRPPQPPEVVSLVNSLSSACSSLRDSSRDSTAASTNDSTAVIVDSSLGGDSSRADSRHSFSDSGQSTVDRSTVDSRHSTADTVNSGLSSRNIDSLNSRSSVLSSRSSGECSSRGSVGSSSRSSSSRAGGSRDDIEASPGSGEADDLAGRPSVGMFEDDLPVSVSVPSTLVVRPVLHPAALRPAPLVLSTFQNTNNEAFQFGAAAQEQSRRSSEASGGATEGVGRERHSASYGEPVGYDELFKTEESGDEIFSGHYGTEEPDPHSLGADSTTLEDVLDSLLALPSASRSPSPVCGHHPLGRPFSHPGYTKSHQEKDNTLPSSPQSLDCPPKHQDDHYGHLRNHNLPTNCKTEGYHKSFSYSSSSGDSSFQQQQQQAGVRPLLHQQHPPPPPEGSPVSFFLARDEGEPHSEPPTTTTTTTTHTPSRARTAHAQSHVHVDPSGRAPTTRRLDMLEAQGPEGTFTAHQLKEADPSTGVLLHQSTALVTHPHSHAYSAAPNPHAHTNLSQNAHTSPPHHPRLSSTPTNDSFIGHKTILQSNSSHNIVPPTPPSYTTPTIASRHVHTTSALPIHSLSSTLPNCVSADAVITSPVTVNSHHTPLPQSYSRGAPSDTRPSHPPASSPRAGTSPGHTPRTSLHKGHHQPHVPGHFVPDSQGSGQVNQLGASPPKRSSQEVVPACQADPLTEALMLSGVIAAVPSIVERQPPPPPPGPRVTFHLPPRHMNIPPDSSSENGNGNENVRVDADDESGSSNLVRCRNPTCGLTADTEEARSAYKTCHNCCTFYCSRACRRQHWERHKKQCKRIRSMAVAKQVVARVRENEAVLERVSAVARRGIRALGRGTVKIFFHDIKAAETFVGGGELPETHYMTIQNLLPQETGPEVYKQITELCKHYNVEYKLVLYVSICIMNEIPTGSSPKWEREMVSHCAKLRLAGGPGGGGGDTWSPRPERHVITRDMDEPETLILTSAPIPDSNTSPQAARHIAFNNIVRHLREKGISLRHQYPDVHRKLTAYVEMGEVFPPLTIYPRDVTTGSTFMCIIMPETDHAKLQLLSNDASKVRTIDISRPHPPA